eukprot:TRINITY_DN2440_c0_g1_i1.p1 TRINITY_DN2440_c0_g1~~TRINITY_DN2440_c0_g1_i1.p1  ORF type:complete len:342 (+),score=69.80 TRINITY_DN2440_c0_g1_i1:44-1027(+)
MAYKAHKKRQREESGEPVPADELAEQEQRLKRIKTGYKNKQHTMILSSRGITYRYRHLMNDLRELIPNHKKDVKFDGKSLFELNEVCEMKSCNNCIFFECRKGLDLYLWVSKSPNGPSAKFHVTDVHTTDELKFSGNCLKGSRPLLYFDNNFDSTPHLKLLKELFMQAFGTPNMHPRSKPFIDHMICFYYYEDRVWFRNYQIAEEYIPDLIGKKKTEDALIEIGPRFVMNPIKILSSGFSGSILYENPNFISPNKVRQIQRNQRSHKYVERLMANEERKTRQEDMVIPPSELDKVFVDDEENNDGGGEDNDNDDNEDEENMNVSENL